MNRLKFLKTLGLAAAATIAAPATVIAAVEAKPILVGELGVWCGITVQRTSLEQEWEIYWCNDPNCPVCNKADCTMRTEPRPNFSAEELNREFEEIRKSLPEKETP